MTDAVCTHSWKNCPVHGTGDDTLPPFKTVLVCLYGDCKTKDGHLFGEDDAKGVIDRVTERMLGD